MGERHLRYCIPLKSILASLYFKLTLCADNKVVFCTGGSGDICSAQVKALVHLGANACIIGRNAEKAARVGKEIEKARHGARVLAIGDIDVRKEEKVKDAVEQCVRELGGIDFVM